MVQPYEFFVLKKKRALVILKDIKNKKDMSIKCRVKEKGAAAKKIHNLAPPSKEV